MGFLDRLLGRHGHDRDREHEQWPGEQHVWQQQRQPEPLPGQQSQQAQPVTNRAPYDIQPRDRNYTDEQAIERYKYMLRTAPPETIEHAHEEAFAKLAPEQRQMVLHDLVQSAPQHEQEALSNAQDDPQTLARLATRAEVRQPGTLVQVFGGGMPGGYSGMYGGPGYGGYGYGGMGGMFGGTGGSLLGSIAGAFIGTMIADQFFHSIGDFGGFDRDDRDDQGMYNPSEDPNNADISTMDYSNDPNAGGNDYSADSGADQGTDFGGTDFGGDFGGETSGGTSVEVTHSSKLAFIYLPATAQTIGKDSPSFVTPPVSLRPAIRQAQSYTVRGDRDEDGWERGAAACRGGTCYRSSETNNAQSTGIRCLVLAAAPAGISAASLGD